MTERPVLRVIRGDASDEEVAALTVVLVALARADTVPEPEPASAWADRAALVRAPRQPGPGAWRASAWPR